MVHNTDDNDTETRRCANCEAELAYARDALRVQEGVIGGTGFTFIATDGDNALHFCCEDCIGDYYACEPDSGTRLRPRIP